jgi:hypothetical protein
VVLSRRGVARAVEGDSSPGIFLSKRGSASPVLIQRAGAGSRATGLQEVQVGEEPGIQASERTARECTMTQPRLLLHVFPARLAGNGADHAPMYFHCVFLICAA